MATSRDIQAQKTRQRIIDCMFELLSSTDYNKIRITDIARQAGVSVGTVYLYFHSKADVATTLVRERNVILTQNQTVDDTRSVMEQYNEYVDSYLRLIQSDGFQFSRGITLAMMEQPTGYPVTELDRKEHYLFDLIEAGIKSGELTTEKMCHEEFFKLFIQVINGTLLNWFFTRDENMLIQGMQNARKLIFLLKR